MTSTTNRRTSTSRTAWRRHPDRNSHRYGGSSTGTTVSGDTPQTTAADGTSPANGATVHGARGRTRPADPLVTIIVPARNEARNLEVVLPLLPDVHEVIVVDGHSVDDTEQVVRRVLPQARFVQQTRRGKGNALACGFEEATGDVIVMFDADGSADAAEIEAYVEALRSGADFAKGSRVIADGGSHDITWLRDAGNRGLTTVVNVLFRTRYTDLCYGYNAFWRDVLPVLALPSSRSEQDQWGDGFEIETLINCRVAAADLAIHEVPSIELERIHGSSNLNTFRDGFRVLRTIVTERLSRGQSHEAVPAAGVLPTEHTEHREHLRLMETAESPASDHHAGPEHHAERLELAHRSEQA